jgi:threonine/homoserine/homoserine lactone efflux protein
MEFLLIAAVHFLALLSPGPDFFVIMQASLRLPTRYGVAICAGIAAANALYLLLAISGLEVLQEIGCLMFLLKYLGAAYLISLGFLLLKTSKQDLEEEKGGDILQAQHLGKQFCVGFFSAILNPKNAIFYLSLFTVMVSPATDFMTRCLYAAWMALVVFLWDTIMVFTIGSRQVRHRLSSALFWIEKASGLVLMIFGVFLPFT